MGFCVPFHPASHHFPVSPHHIRRYRPCKYCCLNPPQSPSSSPTPAYLHLPVYPRYPRRLRCIPLRSSSPPSLIARLSFLLIVSALFALAIWPSDPELSVTRLHLHYFRVSSLPSGSIDIKMGFQIKIRNPNFFIIYYRLHVASIFYRGERLSSAKSAGLHIAAPGVSYVDLYLHVYGDKVLEEIIGLIGDLARGSVPFNTVTEFRGLLPLFFFDVPIKGKISCIVDANPVDETIIHQDCYSVDRDLAGYFQSHLSPALIGRVSSWLRTKLHRGAER